MKKISKIIFSAFVIGIGLFVLIMTFILPKQEPCGNETEAPVPRLILGGSVNVDFLSEAETYFAKNFAFRRQAITAASLIDSGIMSTSANDDVIYGKDGWLFYASTLDDYRDNETITPLTAKRIAVTLELMEEYANDHGARFAFVVAPNKNTVYPEYMPANYISGDGTGNYELLRAASSDVTFVDLTGAFAESEEILYQRLDSHWNNMGASMAELLISEALGREGTDYSEREYTVRQDFRGDLYDMLYPDGTEYDFRQVFHMPSISENGTSEDIEYITENPDGSGTLLMFRDSFGNALAPFMAAEFENAHFTRSVPYDLRKIAEEKADCVVIEAAERNIPGLSERSPIMEAPVRDIDISAEPVGVSYTAEISGADGLLKISGKCGGDFERIFIECGGTVYEAFPLCDGYTAYLPENSDTSSLRLVLYIDGEYRPAYNS